MRKLLVFQHVPFEPLGTLDRMFKDAGFRIRYLNFDRQPEVVAEVARYHGLVVLGGPMSANQLDRHPHLRFEIDSIGRAIDLGLPVLGICLGAQLIAACLGGKTLRGAAPEYGWVDVEPTRPAADDPLFRTFADSERIFQWHSDTFALPHEATHLAASAGCRYQAFRYRDCIYGLQFHLEADRALISRWLSTPQHLRELQELGIRLDASEVMAECDRYLPRATELGRRLFGAFVERFYRFRRRRAHASR
jgi:GMP synthase (glutamine-hydrolysing)